MLISTMPSVVNTKMGKTGLLLATHDLTGKISHISSNHNDKVLWRHHEVIKLHFF